MNKTKFVVWTALTPALSPGRGRIVRRVLSIRESPDMRAVSRANYQGAVTDGLTIELLKPRDSCPLSPGERVRVRASVNLTFLLCSGLRRHHRFRVVWQRMWSTFLQRVENHVTDELLLTPQLAVPKAKLLDAHRGEKFGSFSIMSFLSRMPMMSTVQFDGETGFHAVEIEVVNPTRVIATEFVGAESSVAQPTPHEFFSPSLFLAQSAGPSGVGHGRRLKLRGTFRKIGFYDRLHLGPLPQERENGSPVLRVTRRSCSSIASDSELPECGERQFDARITRDVRKLFPLPGGEGQGEGERHTNIFGGFRNLGLTTALTPALSPRRGRIIRRRSLCWTALDYSRASVHISNSKSGGAA